MAFIPRLKKPEDGNPYYNTPEKGGYAVSMRSLVLISSYIFSMLQIPISGLVSQSLQVLRMATNPNLELFLSGIVTLQSLSK